MNFTYDFAGRTERGKLRLKFVHLDCICGAIFVEIDIMRKGKICLTKQFRCGIILTHNCLHENNWKGEQFIQTESRKQTDGLRL